MNDTPTIPERRPGPQKTWSPAKVAEVCGLLVQTGPNGRAVYSYRKIEAMTGVPYTTVRNWNQDMKNGRIEVPDQEPEEETLP